MTSMVERVARAIFAEFAEEDGYPAMSPAGKARWNAQAKAAIEAMREPTPQMLKADVSLGGYGYADECCTADPREVWQAMLDVALSENDG